MERIIIRMPEDFEFYMAATPFVQNYIAQQYYQYHQRMKAYEPRFTIEVGDDSHLFLNSMFPRIDQTVREQEELNRQDWECVIDLRNITRVMNVAQATNKHITEAWSAMFGANAPKLPTLGPIGATCRNPIYDFLIDTDLDCAEELAQEINTRVEWGVIAKTMPINGKRVYHQFQSLAECKVFVGRRSGASYLAATMGKGCIEVWSKIIPFWFIGKSQSDGYKVVVGEPSAKVLLELVKQIFSLLTKKVADVNP